MSKHASLICYVGNGVVKAAVVINEKNKVPTIVTTRLRELPYHEFIDRDHLESRIMSEYISLIKDIKLKDLTSAACAGIKLSDACVILSSPWYVSETKIVKIHHDKPFVITEKILDDAIAATAGDYMQKQKQGISILERNVIRYLLNGYPTASPLKKTAQHVEISVFLSFCRSKTVDKIKQTILSHLGVHETNIHSQSLAAFTAIKETWKDIPNYVLTDISSQLTELMIVRENSLAEAASFPLGKQFVISELGKRLNTNGEVSSSLLRLYKDNTIDQSLKTKVDEAIVSIRQEWLRPFTKALGEMSAGSSLPSRFILFSPKDTEWLFAGFIKSEEYQQFTFSEGKFEVYEAKVEDFEHSYNIAENVPRDISLAVGTIFLHKKIEGIIY
ncbi:MAG: hypothetical protein V4664_01030 [Patescibacteria group bacterium]